MQGSEITRALLRHTKSGKIQWRGKIDNGLFDVKIAEVVVLVSSKQTDVGTTWAVSIWPGVGRRLFHHESIGQDSLPAELYRAVEEQIDHRERRKGNVDWAGFVESLENLNQEE
jgi:hypothetical protein